MVQSKSDTSSGRPNVDPRFLEARAEAGERSPGAGPPRDDENKSETPVKAPPAPAALRGNKVAQKKWRQLSKSLIKSRTLGETDFDTLESYCLYYAEFIQAKNERDGALMVKTKLGNVIQHPLLSIERNAYDKCQRLREQLGMTPVTRSRISKTTQPGQDDLL